MQYPSDLPPQQAHGRQLGGGDGVALHGVGGGLHQLTGLIFDPRGGQRDAAAIRAEGFQRVAEAPLAPLLAAGDAVLPAVHGAHELPLADVGGAVSGLTGLLPAKVEARRVVAVAGAGQLSQHLLRQLEVLIHRVGQILVEGAAVGGGHAGDVVEGLGAAFDLQAVHARLANEACDAGKVSVNGKEARASYDVKVGDVIEITLGSRSVKVKVTQVKEVVRKEEADTMYEAVI